MMKLKKLWYKTWGECSNPKLIFLHGFMGSHSDHLPLIQLLSKEYFCIALDLPGHGKSQKIIPDSIEEFDSLVLEILAQYKHFTLIGYSMGGRISTRLFNKVEAKSLVLISSRIHPPNLEEKNKIYQRDLKLSKTLLEDPFTLFLKKWYGMPMFKTLFLRPEIFNDMMEKRQKEDPKALSRILVLLSSAKYLTPPLFIKNLKKPLLYISGIEDEKYNTYSSLIHNDKKDTWLYSIQGTSHALHIEDPIQTSQIIKQFHRYYHD